ncbi:hypothetical protein AYR47_28855 [Pseudomonas azotoformans]|uniref:Uncharacterized protein n=1 Tax=Pseudomonas azotoformans TaxID=47878 RepID=A0A127I5V7_PSEAZ|nr:hypothetical protein AYR47_28855 [Pseudomonas azotoformans]
MQYWEVEQELGQVWVLVCISVFWVTAGMGSALTAGHFGKAGMPAQPKVTKGLLPQRSVWPNAGFGAWVTRQDAGLAALGQGWPIAAAHAPKPE